MALTRIARASRVLIGVSALSVALVAGSLSAGAAPHVQTPTSPAQPTTSADVMATLDKLAKDNGKLTERFNQARIDLASAQKASAQAATDAAKAKAALAAARAALASSLAAQYKGASFSRTAALMDSDSGQTYLDKMQSLTFLADHQRDVAQTAAQADAAAKRSEAKAASAVAAAQKVKAALEAQRSTLEAEIAKQKQLLATLTAAERKKLQEQATPPPAQIATVTAAATSAPKVSGSESAAAKTAVQAALSQLGKPYQWGAAGPDSYDCSGLTMWAWAHAGVSLPHQSAEQQGFGTPVSQDQLQPGDLVFFGSPAYHVGIYLGNGMMVHAPTTGDVVKISSLSYMSDYSGAVRVG